MEGTRFKTTKGKFGKGATRMEPQSGMPKISQNIAKRCRKNLKELDEEDENLNQNGGQMPKWRPNGPSKSRRNEMLQ